MAEVLVKIVVELLSILSIATKEVRRRRASELHGRHTSRSTTYVLSEIFARKLLGRTDIEDALKRLDKLIQEEFQMVMAQVLKVTTEVKDGTWRDRLVANITLNARSSRCRKNQPCCASDVEKYGRSKARYGRSKVFVISYPYHLRWRD